MKMIVVVADGNGAFQCGLARNPDLYRRDIAKSTGTAVVVWAGLPVLSTDAQAMVETLKRKVLPHFVAGPLLQHRLAFVIAMEWTFVGGPLLAAVYFRLRSRCRRIIAAIPGLPAPHRLRLAKTRGERT